MDSGLLWFFASLLSVIGPYNLNQYLKRKTKSNPDLLTYVFPRFKQVVCFHFELSLVDDDVNLCNVLTGSFHYFGFGLSALN